ncbi:MAG: hypothetical protein J6386_11395 [Candidatus Synoicihabitans palmerolidicus]|nr:hypothetical protein [Candidatus Synoicihabitans palmerolidicus]
MRYVFDENAVLSPHGIRSLAKVHLEHPFVMHTGDETHSVNYVPGESDSFMFGGNSNWRGPIGFPLNYLLIEALERYHRFYGDSFVIEYPTGSGNLLTLDKIADASVNVSVASFYPIPPPGNIPSMATIPATRPTRTGAIWSCSTSTFTATPAKVSAPATKRAGPPSSPACSKNIKCNRAHD